MNAWPLGKIFSILLKNLYIQILNSFYCVNFVKNLFLGSVSPSNGILSLVEEAPELMLQHHPQIVHFLTSPIYLPENSFPLPLPSEKPDEEREGVKSALCQQFPYQERSFASGSPFSSDWLPDPPKHLASFTFFFVFKNAKFGASLVSQS